MGAVRQLVSFALGLVILLRTWGPAQAQPADAQYFPETGHSVKGIFLDFYNAAADPKLVYGYPITEQIPSRDGKTVQYFQRARLELGKDILGNPRVELTALGRAQYSPGGQLNIDNSSGCRSFLNGFRVCFAFLDFYQANGGAAQFGNPISPFEYRNNMIVQYFENARFEWRADRPEGQRVVISELGRSYFDQLGEDQAHLKTSGPLDATINPVLSIKVQAFVRRSITSSSGDQTIYVVVQSQTLQGLANATGKAVVHWPDGRTDEYPFVTAVSGVGTVSFSFSDQLRGELVPIDILIAYQGLTGRTTTSFRIWY